MRKELKWPKEKTEMVFGSGPDNSPWPGSVVSWVCATFPQQGTVIYDCVPEVSSRTCHVFHGSRATCATLEICVGFALFGTL